MKKMLLIVPLILTSNTDAMLKSQSQEDLAIYYEQHNNPYEPLIQRNTSRPTRDEVVSRGLQRDLEENSACEDCLLMVEESCNQTRVRYTLICCSIPVFVCLFGGALTSVLLLAS